MKPFALAGVAAGLLLAMIGAAGAQSYGGDRPRYRAPDSPRPALLSGTRILSARAISNLERLPTGLDRPGRPLQTLSGILGLATFASLCATFAPHRTPCSATFAPGQTSFRAARAPLLTPLRAPYAPFLTSLRARLCAGWRGRGRGGLLSLGI
jgi:hypothetical protein